MISVIVAPAKHGALKGPCLFLGGSIEMGKAGPWRQDTIKVVADAAIDVTIFNPRREHFNATVEQIATDPILREQVLWELRHLKMSDVILFHFEPGTISPISLFELGLFTGSGEALMTRKVIVSCPDGYFRQGNVELVQEEFGQFDLYKTLTEAQAAVLVALNKLHEDHAALV